MPYTKSAKISGVILLLLLLSCIWYMVAADYSYGTVSGTYVCNFDGGKSTLVLKKDHTYEQLLEHAGRRDQAPGTWRRLGEEGVVFSNGFLKAARQELRPDGQADGEVRKRFGLFIRIQMSPDFIGPVFYKQALR